MSNEQNPHLLIIAHGSRSQKWVDSIDTFTVDVRDVNESKDSFFADVSSCYLEHTNPSIPDAIQELSQTNRTILSIPFFFAPGVHVQQDVPELVMSVGSVLQTDKQFVQVQNNGSNIFLIPHCSASELLAKNALHRLQKLDCLIEDSSLILVYYGSKRFPGIWDELTDSIEVLIKHEHPNLIIKSVYAGDTVDFSPQQTSNAISTLSLQSNNIILLPMLLGVGVIQTDVIPKAIEQSGLGKKVMYKMDSVLPDQLLAKEIWNHAYRFYNSAL